MKAAARLLLILALVAPVLAMAQTKTPAPTCRLFASATIVNYNTKVRLDWATKNATGGYLTEVGAIAAKGSAYVVPGKNTTYAASFTGPGGTIVCRVAVAVRAGGISTDSGAAYGGGLVNIDGTTDVRGSSIDTNDPVNTSGSSVDTNNPVDISGSAIDTNNPVNTNVPVNLGGTVDLGGNVTLPVAPSAPSTAVPSGGLVGGIVPAECRGASTVANCDLCSLAQLGQNLGNFLLGLTIPAAALLFAWAGILYFSSRGNPVQIDRAHKIFKTVVIGFVIAVSAWVLVNTVMNMLIQGGDLKSWNWRELKCADTRKARLYDMSLSQYLSTSLPGLSVYNPSGTGSAFGTSCPYGGEVRVTQEGNFCVNGTQVYPAANAGGAASTPINPLTGGGSGIGRGGCATGDELTAENFCMSSSGTPYYPGTGSRGTSCPSGYVYETEEGGYCQNPNNDSDWKESCPTGYVYTDAEGGYCENPTNPNDWKDVRDIGVVPSNNTDCSASNIQQAAAEGGYTLTQSQANTLSCIAVPESACGRNTSVATTPDGRVTSATGMFQIVFGAGNDQCHNLNIPVCSDAARLAGYDVAGNLNCYSHFRAGKPIDAIGEACKAAASNINCNASAAACLVQARGGRFTDWTADSRSSAQQSCINKFGA